MVDWGRERPAVSVVTQFNPTMELVSLETSTPDNIRTTQSQCIKKGDNPSFSLKDNILFLVGEFKRKLTSGAEMDFADASYQVNVSALKCLVHSTFKALNDGNYPPEEVLHAVDPPATLRAHQC